MENNTEFLQFWSNLILSSSEPRKLHISMETHYVTWSHNEMWSRKSSHLRLQQLPWQFDCTAAFVVHKLSSWWYTVTYFRQVFKSCRDFCLYLLLCCSCSVHRKFDYHQLYLALASNIFLSSHSQVFFCTAVSQIGNVWLVRKWLMHPRPCRRGSCSVAVHLTDKPHFS